MNKAAAMKLDPFYPIFDSADWLARMLPLGVKLVQLRVKDRSEIETGREIARAKTLCAAAGCVLVVNDYWHLAIEEGCDFVHLGQEDLDGADLDAIRKAGIRLGVSSHDEAELERALATKPDYVALGPVYPTILKAMKWGPQGLDRVTEWKRRISDIALVGIGGIFQIHYDGELIWDRKTEGGFPDSKVLKQRVRDRLDPQRSLGHVDGHVAVESV